MNEMEEDTNHLPCRCCVEEDNCENAIGPSPKKSRSEEEIEEEETQLEKELDMMSSMFAECQPISKIEYIDGVLQDPPKWVERVEPLRRRPATVVQNTLSDCHSDFNDYLPRNRFDARIIPKTLICHDYRGGYRNDKYLHFPNEEILGDGYPFYNWMQIDVFVYFSHHLLSIPPLCWINVGHNNGVKILGTFITESYSGSRLCNEKIFKNVEMMQKFARSLAELTKIFGFDGWLLNVENRIDNVEILKQFVAYVTDLVHSVNPSNLVIWYDSVTDQGYLSWQNELNRKNKCFFDACDGIFLNYNWTERHLKNTVEAAKHRNLDVYVGMDVFGRKMFGGGKMFTYKAAEMVTRYNLSMAIFAPGWTHQKTEKGDNFFELFLNKDSAFWSSLWPYLYTHSIQNYFATNFYIGLDKTCYNMFSQQKQMSRFPHPNDTAAIPEYDIIPTLNNKCNCIQAVTVNSRNSCLLTNKNLRKNVDVYVFNTEPCNILEVGGTIEGGDTIYLGGFGIEKADCACLKKE